MKRQKVRKYFWLCSLWILTVFLTGCSRKESEEKKEVPTINIGITAKTGNSTDLGAVNEKLGELTEKKIGVRAQFVKTGLNTSNGNSYYKNRTMGVDIVSMYFSQFVQYCEKNLLLDMKPYMEEADALKEVLKEKAELPEEKQTGIYGIPKPLSDLHSSGVILNRAYVVKYGMDVSKIKQPEDLEPFFDIIKKERPDVVPWVLEKRGNAVLERAPIGDLLDNCLSGILYDDAEGTVCNLYETEAYAKQIRMAKRWREKGYLADDILTDIEVGQMQVISGEAFSAEFVIKPDETQYEESIYHNQVIIVPFENRPMLDTENDWVTVWSIFSETEYPEEAVKVLNLMYHDEDVLNLILYGVEGKHYEKSEDGSFVFPNGVTKDNVGYFCDKKWQYNTPKAGIWSGMSENLEADFEEFKESAVLSPAYGFWLDESKITGNIEKLKAIVAEYTTMLNVGKGADGMDAEAYLEEFRQKLREAGSEELVEEVRRQYESWKENPKKEDGGK